MQKLFMMNREFITGRAQALAKRFEQNENGVSDAYHALFNRAPDAEELALASAFLQKPATGKLSRWEQLAQSLLISNELMYVD